MKIAMISPSRESEKAISGYSKELVKNLNKNNVNVDFVSYEAGKPRTFFKLFKKLKKYDIIHLQHEYALLSCYSIPFFIVYLYFLIFKKYKVITTLHTALSLKQKFKGNFLKNFLRKILYIFQNRLINKASDLIIVHSDFFVPILVNEYKFPREKIKVIPQGIIEKVPKISKEKAKKELNLSGNVYLIMGNLHWDKGADIILRQADKIGKTILIVSSPIAVNDRKQKRKTEYINSLKNIVKDNNFSEYIQFNIKPLNDETSLWWKYFSAADLVIQAYRGAIGSGIVTNAIASKTPIIGSEIPFFKDIEKNYGCLKTTNDFAQAIKQAMISKNYEKMVKECERYMKENGLTPISKKYKKLYQGLE